MDLQVEKDVNRQRGVHAPPLVASVASGGSWTVFAVWQVIRCAICAVLVPVAFLSFLVTMIFGFLLGDPRFPRWGMLAFSVGALVLYWLYLGLMSLFMTLPSHDYQR